MDNRVYNLDILSPTAELKPIEKQPPVKKTALFDFEIQRNKSGNLSIFLQSKPLDEYFSKITTGQRKLTSDDYSTPTILKDLEMRDFAVTLPGIQTYNSNNSSDPSKYAAAISVLLRSAELGEGLYWELPDSLVTLDIVQGWRTAMKDSAVNFYKNYVSPFTLKTSVYTEEIL